MSDCKDIVESKACFKPNDTSLEPVPLIRISKYSESSGGPPVTTYVIGDGTNTIIDKNVFMGGGTISDTACYDLLSDSIAESLADLLTDSETCYESVGQVVNLNTSAQSVVAHADLANGSYSDPTGLEINLDQDSNPNPIAASGSSLLVSIPNNGVAKSFGLGFNRNVKSIGVQIFSFEAPQRYTIPEGAVATSLANATFDPSTNILTANSNGAAAVLSWTNVDFTSMDFLFELTTSTAFTSSQFRIQNIEFVESYSVEGGVATDDDGNTIDISSGVPADWVEVDCGSDVVSEPVVITGLSPERSRLSGTNTFSQPYRSISITALSDDVTIDGEPVPRSFSETLGSDENEQYVQDTVVTGTDYFVTITRSV